MSGSGRRVALITGGARGIGAELAVLLARQGHDIVVVDRCADDPALAYGLATVADLDAVVSACRAAGARALGVVADVRDQAALDAAVSQAEDELDGLDIAIAAAGCVAGGLPTWETDDEVWSTMFDVNVHGVWRLARAAVPALLRRSQPRQGRFVVISSMGGSVGLPMLTAYVAAKHVANGVVRSLAAELGREGVTVNAIAPGSTTTAMLTASAAVYGLPDVAGLLGLHLIDRPLHPAEVAAVAAFVCSEAASGVTGAILPVDAGATSQ